MLSSWWTFSVLIISAGHLRLTPEPATHEAFSRRKQTSDVVHMPSDKADQGISAHGQDERLQLRVVEEKWTYGHCSHTNCSQGRRHFATSFNRRFGGLLASLTEFRTEADKFVPWLVVDNTTSIYGDRSFSLILRNILFRTSERTQEKNNAPSSDEKFVADQDTSSRQILKLLVISGAEAAVVFGTFLGFGNSKKEWNETFRAERPPGDWDIRAVVVMVTYLILSMGLVMFNKWMYIAEGGDFPYPLTLCFLNLLSTTSFLHVAMILFPSVMPSSDYEASPMKTSPMQVFINASVPGFFLVMAMGYGNISMVSLSVAFTTMLKAAKPASVFLVCLVFGIEKFDLARVGIVCGLCITAFCCVWGQSDLHGKASLIYYAGSLSDVFRLVSLKLLVSMPNLDPMTALRVYTLIASVLILPAILALEWSTELAETMLGRRYSILANCVVAVSLNMAVVIFSKIATPVTVSMVNSLGTFGLMYISACLFQTHVSKLQHGAFSSMIILVVMYQFIGRRQTV